MVRHNARKKKIWRKKFAGIAAISRLKSVKNNTIPKSNKEFFMIPYSCKNVDTTGKFWFIPGVPGTMFIKNEKPDPNTGNHYTIVDHSWKAEKHPQPNALVKHTDPKKMNRIEYMEKLAQHKLARWEHKHPKPSDELFNDVEQWKQERETALERFRDFVVSIYDKLEVTATIQTPGGPPYKDIVIGTVKDTGDESKTVEMAKGIVKHAKTIHKNILHAQLLNHKKNSYRLLAA